MPRAGPARSRRTGAPFQEQSLRLHNQGCVRATDVPALPWRVPTPGPRIPARTPPGLALSPPHTPWRASHPPSVSVSLLGTAHERPGCPALGHARMTIARSLQGPAPSQRCHEPPLTGHRRKPDCGALLLRHRVGSLCAHESGRETPPKSARWSHRASYLHHGIEASVRAQAHVCARDIVANGGRQDANGNAKLRVLVPQVGQQNGTLESLKQRCERSAGRPQHPPASCVCGARGVGAPGLWELGCRRGAQASRRRGRKPAGGKAGAREGGVLVDGRPSLLGSSEAAREANWWRVWGA